MYAEELKIPKDRIAVLLGEKGQTKYLIEKKTNTKIKVQSQDGDIFISCKESLNTFITKDIVNAIGRGFAPELALKLLDEDYQLDLIKIKDYSGKSKNKFIRIKGRLIGTKGRARKNLERLTNTYIEVYGKTVGIIGKVENIIIARQAIERILQGSRHGNVYSWLEKQRKLLLTQ